MMTIAEKILARASGQKSVQPGDYVTARIDVAMMPSNIHAAVRKFGEAGITGASLTLWDREKVVAALDHGVPVATVHGAESHKTARKSAEKLNVKYFYDVQEGICHQVIHEKGHVRPGQLIVGADSHTTTYGALNVAATGIGISEMTYVLQTGELWFRVPETIKIEVTGKLPRYCFSKDIILYVAGKYGTDVAQYRSIEWRGMGIDAISMDGRFTMANMSVELGAKFGIFRVDAKTIEYLKKHTDKEYEAVESDSGAVYAETYIVDGSAMEPQVALPHNVGNVKPAKEAGDIRIDQAQIGSCCNGRMEDLETAAKIIKGKKVHPGTRFYVAPASWEIYKEASARGIFNTLVEAGALICGPYCGFCTGYDAVLAAGDNCISATTRNFKGRMGSPDANIFLGTPATVTASAITGRITDPREVM
ncbi:MAG TPA: 3-isopropylmalate dehydratase large subunit [Dehalococcoidales bacterium]|nr:3-isopropylmalate dehydratase large subunit [Dehalococcoidales bacterium]